MKSKQKINQKNGDYPGLTLLHQSRQRYPDNPDQAKLETFPNPCRKRNYWVHFDCPEFTSLCPITGQPDFAFVTIDYIPDKFCLEGKSLKFYLFSYRNHGTFHEAAVNRILEDIMEACRPRRLKVNGRFNPRGGIAITVSAEYP